MFSRKIKIIKHKTHIYWRQMMIPLLMQVLVAVAVQYLNDDLYYYKIELRCMLGDMVGYMSLFWILPMLQDRFEKGWDSFVISLKYYFVWETIIATLIHLLLVCLDIVLIKQYMIFDYMDVISVLLGNIKYLIIGVGLIWMFKSAFAGYSVAFITMILSLLIF